MTRNIRLALALAAVASLFAAAPLVAEDSDHADHHHQLIRIFEGRVRPAVQTLGAADALGWLNYTSRIARVSFAREVAKKLTCTSPGSFRIDGERLISGDIQATQFATLCNLAPGEYDYQVTLRSGIGVGQGGEKTIDGKIVVQ
ncbi:MAG: hypothetical protein JRH10_03510 [Deltaproteobacteria bacterium]|nr:hypothetical protein [Deltaproteobacteria bacterium]MBW2445591.1 hypothetical protein [Deltaproteobacteria bacterium]